MVFKKKVIKRQPIYKVFEGRMKREGRYEEYNRRYKEYKKQGIEWSKAKGMVRDEMGFQGPDIEREIEERFKLWGEAGIPEQIISATDKKNHSICIPQLTQGCRRTERVEGKPSRGSYTWCLEYVDVGIY